MKMLIVGEFMTRTDHETGYPFGGGVGKLFKSLMHTAGINPKDHTFTNVIMSRVPGDRISSIYGPKSEGIPNVRMLTRSKYVRAEYQHEVKRLWDLINQERPNLVLACGDLARWALTSETSIEQSRGRIVSGHAGIPGIKVLPIYSGQQLVMDNKVRPLILADLHKAKRQMEFPEIVRPQRYIHIEPTLEDMEDFFNTYIEPSHKLDIDIETKGALITCVGFAPSEERALVVPFYDERKPDAHYWPTSNEEIKAWQFVRRCCRAGKAVGGQNYQYDMQYLYQVVGIKNPNFTDDTMLMQHSLQPEMRKGLGFLASIYTDELPWKFMHKVAANDKTKKMGDGDE